MPTYMQNSRFTGPSALQNTRILSASPGFQAEHPLHLACCAESPVHRARHAEYPVRRTFRAECLIHRMPCSPAIAWAVRGGAPDPQRPAPPRRRRRAPYRESWQSRFRAALPPLPSRQFALRANRLPSPLCAPASAGPLPSDRPPHCGARDAAQPAWCRGPEPRRSRAARQPPSDAPTAVRPPRPSEALRRGADSIQSTRFHLGRLGDSAPQPTVAIVQF